MKALYYNELKGYQSIKVGAFPTPEQSSKRKKRQFLKERSFWY
jgi:hypothetical protein